MENYYKLFEIPHDADISTLRSAFRKKAKSCHPDLFQHVSTEERKNLQKKFVRLSQAYETLADPKKRVLFDMRLKKTSVKAGQQNVKDYRSTSNSSRRKNFKQKSAFSRSNYKSTSDESVDTLEDLIKDVEKILEQFGLNFKDPLEMLVDWAREIYKELTGVFDEQEEEYNKDNAGLKNKSQNNKHYRSDPLQNIEEELQRLKAKRVKSYFVKRDSKHYKSTDDDIEQELRSIKNKYKL